MWDETVANQIAAGCDVIYKADENGKHPLQDDADKLGLTLERFLEIRSYTNALRKKFPHMKEGRLGKKVAEHFKIKLT